ncbi:MAG: DUF4332 domain-containing protein [Methanolobus sp.]|nr:DUF4332 domain-containing protein [Methanolobus sp.]
MTIFLLEEFDKTMRTAQLLPSQMPILDDLSLNMQRLRDKGVINLQQVHDLLKKKENYPAVSKDTGIPEDYLVILNRMVNSYIVKILPLEKLEIFSHDELEMLKKQNIKNTKQYYEAFSNAGPRDVLSAVTGIFVSRIEYALCITDLLRINGVGVGYAKILEEIGVKSIGDYNKTSSEKILCSVNALNKERAFTKATLGISDIDYCRRFCEKLDKDID